MLKKHRKNVLQSKCIEKKREKESMTPLKNKSKKRISKKGVFRKTQKYPTNLHISIKLHD
jgi:hypothetical protein